MPSQADARLRPFARSFTTGRPESQASKASGAPKATAFDVQMSAHSPHPVQAASTAEIVKKPSSRPFPSSSLLAESACCGQAAAQSPQAVHFVSLKTGTRRALMASFSFAPDAEARSPRRALSLRHAPAVTRSPPADTSGERSSRRSSGTGAADFLATMPSKWRLAPSTSATGSVCRTTSSVRPKAVAVALKSSAKRVRKATPAADRPSEGQPSQTPVAILSVLNPA